MDTPNTFGEALRRDRSAAQKTLSDLALDLDIPLAQIRSWEADATKPRVRKLEQLIAYFGPQSLMAAHGQRLCEQTLSEGTNPDEPLKPLIPPAYLPIEFHDDCMRVLGRCLPSHLMYAQHRLKCRRKIVRTPPEKLAKSSEAQQEALHAQQNLEASFDKLSKAVAWCVELELSESVDR